MTDITPPSFDLVPDGTRVLYHGSLKHYHGEMTVRGLHEERVPTYGEFSPVRYMLSYGEHMGDYLYNVRPESFTVINDDNGHA